MTNPRGRQDGNVVVIEYDVGPGAYGVAAGREGAMWTGRVGAGELVRIGPDGG